MRRQPVHRFTVQTARGRGSYRSRLAATCAAEWVAGESGETVLVSNDTTGETWHVYPIEPARAHG
jgi:hypothetical protein